MKYMLLYAGDEHAEGIAVPEDPGAADEDCAGPWLAGLAARQVRHLAGGRLLPTVTATTVRLGRDSVLLSDGPFAETKEQILGFDVIECASLDDAVVAASEHPVAQLGGAVEVRPLLGS